MLKTLRKAAKLTQLELAQRVNVAQASINRYEKGTRSPRPSVAARIAVVLNIPEEKIFEVFYKKSPPT